MTDEDKRAILYDETLADAVAKHLRLKAAWQERELRKICEQDHHLRRRAVHERLSDRPSSRWSATWWSSLLTETMAGIQGLIGVHCCGNTDWSLLLETPVHILNFDAYAYAESLALYPEEVKRFLRRGGTAGLGHRPVRRRGGDPERAPWTSMTARLLDGMGLLVQKGIALDELLDGCLVSPSCGLGGRSEKAAVRALELSAGIAAELQAAVSALGR